MLASWKRCACERLDALQRWPVQHAARRSAACLCRPVVERPGSGRRVVADRPGRSRLAPSAREGSVASGGDSETEVGNLAAKDLRKACPPTAEWCSWCSFRERRGRGGHAKWRIACGTAGTSAGSARVSSRTRREDGADVLGKVERRWSRRHHDLGPCFVWRDGEPTIHGAGNL